MCKKMKAPQNQQFQQEKITDKHNEKGWVSAVHFVLPSEDSFYVSKKPN